MNIGLFEATKTTSQALVINMTNYLINMDWEKKLFHMWKINGQIWMQWQLLLQNQLSNVKF
jgi:hypothetical protein